jgi:hypothetical protein
MEKINTSRYIIRNKITKDYYTGAIYAPFSDNVFSSNIDNAVLYIGEDGFSMAHFDMRELVNSNDLEILKCETTYLLKNVSDI